MYMHRVLYVCGCVWMGMENEDVRYMQVAQVSRGHVLYGEVSLL